MLEFLFSNKWGKRDYNTILGIAQHREQTLVCESSDMSDTKLTLH